MAPTLTEDLSPEFKNRFNITQIHSSKKGGQKKVFIVTRDGVKCALKVFNSFGKRDIRELNIYEQFKELDGIPKIISIEDHEEDKVVFEEYIEGSSLDEICKDYERNPEKIRELILKITSILAPIWLDGKIHRDLKPKNIMIRSSGEPVVIDFGIAQDLTGSVYTTHFVPNTWDFASPEQLLNQRDLIDYRSDFFSLGVLAYTLYYQRGPFGKSFDEVMQKFSRKDTSYDMDKDCKLNVFLKECLGPSPSDRPRDLSILIKTLQW